MMQEDSHMKFAAILFSILLFINGILLSFQYHVFSTNPADTEKAFSYTQDIEIKHKGNAFYVKHTFKNLPEQEMTILWPEAAKQKACPKDAEGKEDKKNCSRFKSNVNGFKEGTETTQSISYRIPLPKGGLESGKLYDEMFLTLKQGIVLNTKLQIIDENRKGGQWFTGLPKIGEQSLNLVDYAYFTGNGGVYELYWSKNKVKKAFESDELTVYSTRTQPANLTKALSKLELLNSNHMDIIETPSNQKSGSRILFTNTLEKSALQERVAVTQVKRKYQINQQDQVLSSILASFETNTLIGNSKARTMVKTLNDYFSSNQRTQWKDGLQELEGKKVTSSVLDRLLSDILQLKTSYFQMNEANAKAVVPLMFEEKRPIYVNGQKVDNVKIILKDDMILYTANPLLKQLGYDARIGENGYYVKNASRSFRFPGEPYDFYVYNDLRQDVPGVQPLIKIAGTYYVEEGWLIKLFRTIPEKKEDRIELNEQK